MSYKRIEKYKLKQCKLKILYGDIETILLGDTHIPVILCLVGENISKIFNIEKDFSIAYDFIIKNCSKSIIYFHNLGRFDGIFIIKKFIEANNKSIKVLERNNVIYKITDTLNNIQFKDSALIIPLSLEQIGNTFCKNNKKSLFSYKNINNIYKETPEKLEFLCLNDCLVLKEGFETFRMLIKEKFFIDVFTQLTLPSTALNIFKYLYYDPDKTPISKNPYNVDFFIRRSYLGGLSEVFKPYLKKGYCYDANSLYPSIMKNNKFPIGKPVFVKKEEIDLKNFIGFIECDVFNYNKKLNFLPYRDKIKGLISPIGRWTSVYYYKEIIKAIELGYKIEFRRGLKYEKEDYIFKNYVENIYNLRNENKDNPLNSICKLLLNSLYGRFGMKVEMESTKFINFKDVMKIKKTYNILNIDKIHDDMFIINVKKKIENIKDEYSASIDTETAVQIASAVTSLSRIFMYDFKNIPGNECYYTDTDSVFLKDKLESKYLNNDLGGFKLEYEFTEGKFISSKIYEVDIINKGKKLVFKGLKKEEIETQFNNEIFDDIINNRSDNYMTIKRKNFFKINHKKLYIGYHENEISFKFPFNKRLKIYNENNVWVDTEPLFINNLE